MITPPHTEPPTLNDFPLVGLKEKHIPENPDYITVYEFEKQDYPTYHSWLSENMIPLFSLTFVYLAGVYGLQRWMRDRKPFNLRGPLFLWNVFLAGLSVAMFCRLLPEMVHVNQKYGFYRSYCHRDHTNQVSLFWMLVYGASKILEFIDTAFIILRKNKLTFLHTFHHASIYIATLFAIVRLDPASRYFALFNTFVHSVMYTYYALKAAKFNLPRRLAMAVTGIQLVQFLSATAINLLVFHAKVTGTEPRCDRPNDISAYFLALGLFYFYLFGNFFVQSYLKKNKFALQKKNA